MINTILHIRDKALGDPSSLVIFESNELVSCIGIDGKCVPQGKSVSVPLWKCCEPLRMCRPDRQGMSYFTMMFE